MVRKQEITVQAVIYTKDGVKVVDAEVRRMFNAQGLDECVLKNFKYPEEYMIIGAARTIPTDNIYAMPAYDPDRIQRAVNYGESKFFRLMLDLMRQAQWEPINKANRPLDYEMFVKNSFICTDVCDVDYSKRGFELDAQLYFKYGFTPAMVNFTEARYK